MKILICAGLRGDDKVAVNLGESADGRYATMEVGGLSVVINDREKLLEISSLLEQAAQKWEISGPPWWCRYKGTIDKLFDGSNAHLLQPDAPAELEYLRETCERLHAALRHVVRLYMVDDQAYNPGQEVERVVRRLLSNAPHKPRSEAESD